MGAGRWFDFTDASIRGDPRWAQASKWTGWAGPLVLTILAMSIIQIVLGVIIIVSKNNDLTL
jgi:type II secretory pathway component PulF